MITTRDEGFLKVTILYIKLMAYYDVALIKTPEWYGYTDTLEPVIIKASNYQELRKKSKVKGLTVLKTPGKKLFRRAVEKSLVDAVLPNRMISHDYFHHRRTLLSNVTAKLMNKNKVSLLFTFKELRNSKGERRALIWGRMKQEIRICVKKAVPIIIASGAEKEDELVGVSSLIAMGELLGLRPEQAKKALSHVQEKIIKRATSKE